MNEELEHYLSQLNPANREAWDWGEIKLKAKLYLTDKLPPLDFISSARAVLFKDNQIMTLTNPGETHILPGGRREAGETLLDTVQRECLEETGWSVQVGQLIAVTHCQHQTPKPTNYPFPYPDFIQVIYIAEAIERQIDGRIDDDYETDSRFELIDIVKNMPLTPNQHLIFERALSFWSE